MLSLQTELQSKVKKIYDQYLASSSPHTVNIDDRVLKQIEAKLSNPPLDIFSEAQEQVCVCECVHALASMWDDVHAISSDI